MDSCKVLKDAQELCSAEYFQRFSGDLIYIINLASSKRKDWLVKAKRSFLLASRQIVGFGRVTYKLLILFCSLCFSYDIKLLLRLNPFSPSVKLILWCEDVIFYGIYIIFSARKRMASFVFPQPIYIV